MVAAVIELTNGVAPSTPSSGLVDIFANATKQVGFKDDAGNTLLHPVIREDEIAAVKPQVGTIGVAAPTGNVSTVAKMMGLAGALTPQVTGRVLVIITGVALNATAAGDGTSITGKYGTGSAPANAAASTGSTFGLQQHFVASTTAGQQGFTCIGVISGLTLNTPVWFDLEVVAVTAGGSTLKDVQGVMIEL